MSCSGEEKGIFELLSECIEDPVFIKDRSRKYTFVNRHYCDKAGLSAEDIIGKRYEELFPGEIADLHREKDESVLGGEKVTYKSSMKKGDSEYLFKITKVPVRDGDGQVTCLCGISRDITEQTRLSKNLVDSQRAESLVGLVADIAHDFNNFIYGITGYITLAISALEKGHPSYADLQEVIKAAEQAREYTKKLQEPGRDIPARPGSESVGDLLTGLGHIINDAFPENIRLVVPDCHITERFLVDRGRIERALLNICINSRDAMPDGGVIRIETEMIDIDDESEIANIEVLPGRYLQISISDTGDGVEPELREKVFEPFFTTRKTGGAMGLGLSIAYGIIRDHRGSIRIESPGDEGTRVIVLIPTPETAEKWGISQK